jgi:hypothetical protein
MMALRAHARGGPEQLVYEQAPAPTAGPGEMLIASGGSRAERLQAGGELADHSQGRPPKGPTEQDNLCGYQQLDAEHWLGKYSAIWLYVAR